MRWTFGEGTSGGVIWGEGGRSGGSFEVRVDVQGVIWDEGGRSGVLSERFMNFYQPSA